MPLSLDGIAAWQWAELGGHWRGGRAGPGEFHRSRGRFTSLHQSRTSAKGSARRRSPRARTPLLLLPTRPTAPTPPPPTASSPAREKKKGKADERVALRGPPVSPRQAPRSTSSARVLSRGSRPISPSPLRGRHLYFLPLQRLQRLIAGLFDILRLSSRPFIGRLCQRQ